MNEELETTEWTDRRTPEEVAKLEWDRTTFWDEWWNPGSNSFEEPVTVSKVRPVRCFRGSEAEEIYLKKRREKGLS